MGDRSNFGERQAADRPDWGFHAHLSLYAFAAEFVRGRRCLEVGCGTGYGTRLLLECGATEVIAIDKDVGCLADLAAAHPALRLQAGDIDLTGLRVPPRSVDVVFSSNVFEHLAYPDEALAQIGAALVDDGLAIIAVPPILSPGMLAENARNIFHVNNIPPAAWVAKLGRFFETVRRHRHWVRPEKLLPTGDIERSAARTTDFLFSAAGPLDEPTITAIFVAGRPRRPPRAATPEAEACPAEWRADKVEADARQKMVTDLKRQLGEIVDWAATNRASGVDAGFIIDSICRQLAFLTDRAS